MKPSLEFIKVHGAGNDFVLIDQSGDVNAIPAVSDDGAVSVTALDPALGYPKMFDPDESAAVAWCDRHRGIGADGLLLLRRDADGAWRLRIMNSDGSLAEMCGNGIRCVARYLVEHRGAAAEAVIIRTDAGPRTCRVLPAGSGAAGPWQVTVNMGLAEVAPSDEAVELAERALTFRRVSTGNPHAVILSEDPMGDAERFGARVEEDASFPARTNVEFVGWQGADRVRVVVHERGCGITQACGTGATAVAAALMARGEHDPARALEVLLPGGSVTIRRGDAEDMFMTGPAEVVFQGSVSR